MNICANPGDWAQGCPQGLLPSEPASFGSLTRRPESGPASTRRSSWCRRKVKMKAEGAALSIGSGSKLAIRLGPCGELQLRNSCFSELVALWCGRNRGCFLQLCGGSGTFHKKARGPTAFRTLFLRTEPTREEKRIA